MRYSHLCADEILRYCNPETELEKRMFEILEHMRNAAIDAIESINSSSFESAIDRLEEGYLGIGGYSSNIRG